MKPLAVDLCAGLGGWTDGLLAEGWDCVGYDVERHKYGSQQYPAQLVLQDVLTLDGRQFRGKVSLIVASPPCQKYSYMAMPWKRAKDLIKWHRDPAHPERIEELNAIFNACVRIGREAECPIVIENVRGIQPWVGRSRWHYGSFHLFGDVPALMPITLGRGAVKVKTMGAGWYPPDHPKHVPGLAFNTHAERTVATDDSVKIGGARGDDWFTHHNRPEFEDRATKNDGGSWFNVAHNTTSGKGQNPDGRLGNNPARGEGVDGVKQTGISGERTNGKGDRWFQDGAAASGSKSSARKAASARIAKIPLPLARHIARTYYPS